MHVENIQNNSLSLQATQTKFRLRQQTYLRCFTVVPLYTVVLAPHNFIRFSRFWSQASSKCIQHSQLNLTTPTLLHFQVTQQQFNSQTVYFMIVQWFNSINFVTASASKPKRMGVRSQDKTLDSLYIIPSQIFPSSSRYLQSGPIYTLFSAA